MEEEQAKVDRGRRHLGPLPMKTKVVVCGAAYFSCLVGLLMVSAPFVITQLQMYATLSEMPGQEGLGISGSLEEAQARWDSMIFHIGLMDSSVYPQGKADPGITIPRDVAAIPHELYERILPEVEEIGGTVAREVLLSFGKIKIDAKEPGTIPPGNEYMELIGMDSSYIEIFLNSSPRLQLADCPRCAGVGCRECNWTGKWGSYPHATGGGITMPKNYMDEQNLTLYYSDDTGSWAGSNITALYDLEGRQGQIEGGDKLGEYLSILGSAHTPPSGGVALQIVGVTVPGSAVGLIYLDDAWTLKAMEKDRMSSFIYLRIPDIRDFGRLNAAISKHYSQYKVCVRYPSLRYLSPKGLGLPPILFLALIITIAVIISTLTLRSRRMSEENPNQ